MVDNILQTWKKKRNWIKIETQEKQKEKKGWKQICIRVLYENINSHNDLKNLGFERFLLTSAGHFNHFRIFSVL